MFVALCPSHHYVTNHLSHETNPFNHCPPRRHHRRGARERHGRHPRALHPGGDARRRTVHIETPTRRLPPLHLACRGEEDTRGAEGAAPQPQARMDVRQLLPQHPREHRPLPTAAQWRRRHLRLYRRHSRHVAARLGRAGLPLCGARQPRRAPAPHAARRHPPTDEVHQHRPLRQRLQRWAHRRGVAEGWHQDAARGVRTQV